MNRRSFLKTTAATLATTQLHAAVPKAAPLAGGRQVFPINRKWRFSPTVPPNGHAVAFDDSHFDQVIVPHTNRMLPWHGFDDRTYEFIFSLPPSIESTQRLGGQARLRGF